MLMVIFGAGASYDSVEAVRPGSGSREEELARPPLADELFANRGFFVDAMNTYRDCLPLIPRLRNRENGLSVEEMLGKLFEDAPDYPSRNRQFAAIRFYLHDMLSECQRLWLQVVRRTGTTNHVALLDHIERWRSRYKDGVCLVTFNYDVLIENALYHHRIGITSLGHYISNPTYKLIKAHGSITWAREVVGPKLNVPDNDPSALIEHSEELELAEEFVWKPQTRIGRLVEPREMAAIPALAIPLVAKAAFECPSVHQEVLRECIPKVTKLLVVGWRGAERHFLDLLSTLNPATPIPGLVIAGNRGAASEIVVGLAKVSSAVTWSVSNGGFSDFVRRGRQIPEGIDPSRGSSAYKS